MSEFNNDILCATSTRADGNMDFRFGDEMEVIANRTRFLAEYGLTYTDHIAMRCDHKDVITVVDHTHPARAPLNDRQQVYSEVLITQERNLALMLFTADCQSASFYDPITKTIALAHISRQTLVDGLSEKTISFMRQEFAVDPNDLYVHIGPSIHKENYAFTLPLQHTPPLLAPYIEEIDGYAHIDLLRAHSDILIAHGIQKDRISISPEDTGDGVQYFSHHHSVRTNSADEARMANILMMR